MNFELKIYVQMNLELEAQLQNEFTIWNVCQNTKMHAEINVELQIRDKMYLEVGTRAVSHSYLNMHIKTNLELETRAAINS